MAPNIKVARAYKAMKAFGYSSQTVKPVLKNLLNVYDQNWELIEDEKYKILLDAIIESEECKGDKMKEQEHHLLDEPQRKLAKTYETMKALGYSQQMVEPILKNFLDLYDQNWELIEDEQYRVLLDAILENEENKGEEKKQQKSYKSDGHIENGMPERRYRLRSQTLKTSTSSGHSSPSLKEAANKQLGSCDKQKMTESGHHHLGTKKTEAEGPYPLKSHQGTGIMNSPSYCSGSELNEKIQLLHDENSEECGPQPLELLLTDDDCGSKKNVLDKYHTDAANELEQSPGDYSEFEVPLAIILPDEETNATSNASQLDIASSSSGEAKISITYKSSLGSNFCVPTLAEVLRQMDEDFLDSYGIRQPGLFVTKFMKDLCECFLAAGTVTKDDKGVSLANVQSDLYTEKKFDSQDVSSGSINNEKALCIVPNISLEALRVENLIEVVPQIPRLHGLNCLDFRCCKIVLPLNGVYGENCLNLKVLDNLNPSTASSMMIVPEQNFTHNMLSSTYYVEDITRGEEELKVSLMNEFNESQPNFKYIAKNISYRNAYLQFSLARISDDNCCSNCFGDCLSSEIPCACASEAGGDFAYVPGGLVKEKFLEDCISMYHSPEQKNLIYCKDCPLERSKNKSLSGKCKGHLFRKFIKECWYKCGCGMKCGNRVVQRGITVRLQVFMTPEGKGWGLRTLEGLPKGAFICEYVGEVVTNLELFDRNKTNTGEKHTYPVLLDADWGTEGVLKDEEALCLDATFYGNVARFINHRCDDANLVEIPVEVETPDHHYYHVAFFATRKINALEELTWDYGIDFNDDAHPVKAFQCCCGSQFCRDIKPLKRRRIN